MKTIIPVVIYILIPIIGVVLFIYTYNNVKPKRNEQLFAIKLFILFACLGGSLLLLLTSLFWVWSGLATVGSLFLFLVAPFVMIAISYDSYKKRDDKAESVLFKSSLIYYLMLPLNILVAFLMDS